MKYENLGCHANIESFPELGQHTDLFQIFLTQPQKVVLEKEVLDHAAARIRAMSPDAKLVVHGPYWYNLQAENKLLKATMKSILLHLEVCAKYKIPYYVIHTGTRKVSAKKDSEPVITGIKESIEFAQGILLRLLGGKPDYPKLLLENMPNLGEKGYDVAHILEIKEYLFTRSVFNIGLCFDIEHAYARGELVEKYLDFIEAADVVHFNTVPEKVKFGKGLDRHSTTSINESVGMPPESLYYLIDRFPKKWKIMEMYAETALKAFGEVKEKTI